MANFRFPLAISIVLNVFMFGALVGGFVVLHAPKPRPLGNLRQAVGQLPQPERHAFRQSMRAARMELRQTFRDSRQARREAAALLQQPKLDTTALLAALARARTAEAIIRAKLEEQIVAFAAASPPNVRRLLAEGIGRHVPKRLQKK